MNENAKAWIEALKSGKYVQGFGSLRTISSDGNSRYCCLGVACCLYAKYRRKNLKDVLSEGSHVYLPFKVKKWLGIKSKDSIISFKDARTHKKCSLAGLNDTSLSFLGIAKVLEENQKVIFNG